MALFLDWQHERRFSKFSTTSEEKCGTCETEGKGAIVFQIAEC